MKKYNYEEEVKASVKDYIEDNCDFENYDYGTLEEATNELEAQMINNYNVTGGGSDAYFPSTQQASEALAFNLDLLKSALMFWGYGVEKLDYPDLCDMYIRQFLLRGAIEDVLKEDYNFK